VQLPLPRNVQGIRLASGKIGYYWYVPTKFRKQGCRIPNEPLGTSYVLACGEDGKGGRAAACNALYRFHNCLNRGIFCVFCVAVRHAI